MFVLLLKEIDNLVNVPKRFQFWLYTVAEPRHILRHFFNQIVLLQFFYGFARVLCESIEYYTFQKKLLCTCGPLILNSYLCPTLWRIILFV